MESMASAGFCGLSLIPRLLNPFCSSFSHIIINNCGGEMKTVDASVSL